MKGVCRIFFESNGSELSRQKNISDTFPLSGKRCEIAACGVASALQISEYTAMKSILGKQDTRIYSFGPRGISGAGTGLATSVQKLIHSFSDSTMSHSRSQSRGGVHVRFDPFDEK